LSYLCRKACLSVKTIEVYVKSRRWLRRQEDIVNDNQSRGGRNHSPDGGDCELRAMRVSFEKNDVKQAIRTIILLWVLEPAFLDLSATPKRSRQDIELCRPMRTLSETAKTAGSSGYTEAARRQGADTDLIPEGLGSSESSQLAAFSMTTNIGKLHYLLESPLKVTSLQQMRLAVTLRDYSDPEGTAWELEVRHFNVSKMKQYRPTPRGSCRSSGGVGAGGEVRTIIS